MLIAQGGANPIELSTNGVVRVYIKDDGSVGIGTTVPKSKVSVVLDSQPHASLPADADVIGYSLYGDNPSGGGIIYAVIHAQDDGTTCGEFTGYKMRGTCDSPTDLAVGDEIIKYAGVGRASGAFVQAGYIQFETDTGWNTGGAPSRMRLALSTVGSTIPTTRFFVNALGACGFNTDTPDCQVHIFNSSAGTVSANAVAILALERSNDVGLQFLTPNNKYNYIFFGDADSNSIGQLYYYHTTNLMGFVTNGITKMVITSDGYVGIGTTEPKSALQVVGLPIYANNAAALAGGLTAGAFYRTGGDPDPVCVVH